MKRTAIFRLLAGLCAAVLIFQSGPVAFASIAKELNTYDPASRISQRIAGGNGTYVTTNFTYDDAGQITEESDSNSFDATYQYDKNGNRTQKVQGGITSTYSYDAGDKLTQIAYSGTGAPATKYFDYDIAGRNWRVRQNGSTIRTNTWDRYNRLTSAAGSGFSTVTGTYNGLGARVTRTVSSTTTSFKRAEPGATSGVLSETVGSSVTRYVPGISERNGTTSLFYHGGIKNSISQTDTSTTPAVTATKQYDAFGAELNSSGTWSGRNKYGGQVGYQTEEGAGFKLLGSRWYDPEIGRFLSRDTVHNGRNWYSYCANNPISYADPSGHRAVRYFGYLQYERIMAAIHANDGNPPPFDWMHALGTGYAALGYTAANMLADSVNMTPLGNLYSMLAGHDLIRPDAGSWADEPGFYQSSVSWGVALTALSFADFLASSCFVEGTQVLMADRNSKAIEDLKVGDWVVTRNENADENAPVTVGVVSQTFKHLVDETVKVKFKDGSAVQCTDGHKFYVVGKGWTEAAELHNGHSVASNNRKTEQVASVTWSHAKTTVYNIGISNSHTYFVGGAGNWHWVHNMFCRAGRGTWPHDPAELDEILGVKGRPVPDGPTTPGRGKTLWKLEDGSEIRHEQHPYFDDPSWEEAAPHYQWQGGPYGKRKWFPGDPFPLKLPRVGS